MQRLSISRIPLVQRILIGILSPVAAPGAVSQQFSFPSPRAEDPAELSRVIPTLAREVIAAYRDDDQNRYLDTLFRLQIVAGEYSEAIKTLTLLRDLPAGSVSPQARAAYLMYEVLAETRAVQKSDGPAFDEALQQSFRKSLASLDDRTSAMVVRALGADQSAIGQTLADAVQKQKRPELDSAFSSPAAV